ncbi:MAG: hypothetical protein NDJ92_10495 [Thermoanaerobaculia bacterium]|nr:hypothetical protein [Thermoanaerobaculia bacterium]
MKRGAVVGVLVAVVAVVLAGCRESAQPEREAAESAATRPVEGARGPWGTNYRAPSGEFIIQLPEAPKMRKEADGRTVYQLRTADYAYTINKLACPAEFAGDADPTALYDKLRLTIVAAVNGQAMSEYPVRAVGAPTIGREVVLTARTPSTDEPYEMVVRLFRDGDAVWLLQAIGPQTPKSRADRVGVLDTFTFLE